MLQAYFGSKNIKAILTTNILKVITGHQRASRRHLKKKYHESLSHKQECDILSIWENHRARRLYPSYFSEGSSSPPDGRKEGEAKKEIAATIHTSDGLPLHKQR